MIKKNNSLIIGDKVIDTNYNIPEGFTKTTPNYFKNIYDIFEERCINNNYFYPILSYALFYNDNGDMYSENYNNIFRLGFNLKSTALPLNVKPKNILLDNNNFLEEFFKNDGFVNSKQFFDKIDEMSSLGYNNVKISVGIWTESCILQENIIEFDKEQIALALTNAEVDAYSIYNNSPDLVKLEISKIFANEEIKSDNCDTDVLRAKGFLDTIFKSEGKDEILNDEFYNSMETVFYKNANLFMFLNKKNNILESIIRINNQYDFTIDSFLIILGNQFNYFENSSYKKPVEMNNKDYNIEDFDENSSFSITHRFSNYGRKLLNS